MIERTKTNAMLGPQNSRNKVETLFRLITKIHILKHFLTFVLWKFWIFLSSEPGQ